MSTANGNSAPRRRNVGFSKIGQSEQSIKSPPVGEELNGHLASNTELKKPKQEAATMVHWSLPALLSWGVVTGLIFGGCCSNVFTLETIVKEEPDSGLLITFTQFLVTALFTWPSHFSRSHPPFFLKPRAIPLKVWIPSIVLFFAINTFNNYAFGYNISVPVHIILRSGGSVMTMIVGYIWGKRYTRVEVLSVILLTLGVIMAAMADAQSKGKTTTSNTSTPLTGLLILFIAQLLSAIMGLYIQLTYAKYGSHWHENLFYSHFLALPLFLPFRSSLIAKFRHLQASPPLSFNPITFQNLTTNQTSLPMIPLPSKITSTLITPQIPTHLANLIMNALTQYICIRGVNLLAAQTSALGVTVVLNLRKLVSLFISIWVFGNTLPAGVVLGAAVVFGSAGLWGWEGQRKKGRVAVVGEAQKGGEERNGDGGRDRNREKMRERGGKGG